MERNRNSGLAAFIRTPIGIGVAAFLAIAGFLLIAEHRAHILIGDWGLGSLLLICVVMHHFMHGSHGGHGGRRSGPTDHSSHRDNRSQPGTKGDA